MGRKKTCRLAAQEGGEIVGGVVSFQPRGGIDCPRELGGVTLAKSIADVVPYSGKDPLGVGICLSARTCPDDELLTHCFNLLLKQEDSLAPLQDRSQYRMRRPEIIGGGPLPGSLYRVSLLVLQAFRSPGDIGMDHIRLKWSRPKERGLDDEVVEVLRLR